MNKTRTLAAAFAATLLLAACGGGGDDPVAPPNILPSGASIVSDDGKATLTVPAGAASAPQRVNLLAAPQTQLPANAAIVAGSVYRIEGDGGALAAPATLRIETQATFPQGVAPRRDRKQALGTAFKVEAPDPRIQHSCDLDGDGISGDPDDVVRMAAGESCLARPRVVDLSKALGHVGMCDIPVGSTVSCDIHNLAPSTLGVTFDAEPPSVTVESFDGPVQPAKVTATGTYRMRVAAGDNHGVVQVDFYLGRQREGYLEHKLVSLTGPPYEASFEVAPGDAGAMVVYAEAFDTNGNSRTAGVLLEVALAGAPVDTTPPVVTLAASSTAVQVGQGATLTATATDLASAIAKVEFFRGTTKVGEDLSAPFEYLQAPFGAGDVGVVSYTARAVDAAGNAATSTAVAIAVSSAVVEAWVNPASGSDGNAGTAAAPYRTLGKAFAAVGPGGTAWLQNGNYTSANEGLTDIAASNGLALPAGAALKAVNEGGATVGITLQVPAGGSVAGLAIDTGQQGRIFAKGGTLAMSRTRFVRVGAGVDVALEVSGSTRVFVDSGGSATFNYASTGVLSFARVLDQAELHVTGGQFDGLTGQPQGIVLGDTARLALIDVTFANTGAAWVGGEAVVYIGGTANRVDMTRTRFDMRGALTACIQQNRQVAGVVTEATQIVLVDTVVEGCASGVQLREGRPRFEMTGGAIRGSTSYWGIHAGRVGFDSSPENQFGTPLIRLRGVTFADNYSGSILMNNGGELDIDGGVFASAGSGIELLSVQRYTAKIRNASLQSGTVDTLFVEGDAASSFDFGTAAAPGGNTLASTFLSTPLLRIGAAAGVRVDAVGNRWRPVMQGSDSEGRYGPASVVCAGANPCDVPSTTTLLGTNFRFLNAGPGASLRLTGP